MGHFFQESVETESLDSIAKVEPSTQGKEIISQVDVIGDTAGAMGIPFASFAGELLAGVFSLTSIVLSAKLTQEKKAGQTMAKTIEREGSPTLKSAILKQSVKDGTASAVHKAAQRVS